jgi:hypothetical protein
MIDAIFIIFVYSLIFIGLIYFIKGLANPENLKSSQRNSLPKRGVYGILWLLIGMLLLIFAGFMFL